MTPHEFPLLSHCRDCHNSALRHRFVGGMRSEGRNWFHERRRPCLSCGWPLTGTLIVALH